MRLMQKLKPGVETVKLNLTVPRDLRDGYRKAIGNGSVSKAVRAHMEQAVADKASKKRAGAEREPK